MSPIRSILLHLDSGERSAVRMRIARDLARQFEASLTTLYAVTSTLLDLPFASVAGSSATLELQEIDAARRAGARALFDKQLGAGGPTMAWNELVAEPLVAGFTEQALYADLLVLGQREPDSPSARDVPADFIESVLMGSGRPALIVPYAGDFTSVGGTALVAWKPSRDAAHAVTAALPLLQRARTVHVATWAEAPAPSNAPQLDIVQYLRLHGVQAELRRYGDAPGGVGESLLSLAADLSADLLVMGCYGHSRARELVLGGASRSVLRSMTLPVLMAH